MAEGSSPKPSFGTSEALTVQMAAAALLCRIEDPDAPGARWTYLPRTEALAARGGSSVRTLLTSVLLERLEALNAVRSGDEERPFSRSNLARAVATLEDVPLVQGVLRASEAAYDLIRLGKSFDETVGSDVRSFTIRYVDWENPANNVYHVATEVPLRRPAEAGAAADARADVVLYVNGIPFVHMECKAPDVPIDEAVRDVTAYHSPAYAPDLAKFIGIAIASNRTEAKYAAVGTPAEFWAVWRSKETIDPEIRRLLAAPLAVAERERIGNDFVRERRGFYEGDAVGREPTETDRLLYELCRPSRLLKLVREYTLFDAGERKIARHQQFYAVERAIARVTSGPPDGPRPGGTIWHTQGSGKSLTMVMLANALVQTPRTGPGRIENPRIVLVTDRKDLDRQITGTFRRCGVEVHRATSGADLRRRVTDPKGDVLTVLVNKFAAATRGDAVLDASRDLFVLVDEGHRTQYGGLAAQMRRIFPNACYLGFTGTPLMRGAERNTLDRFGGLIDTYTMKEAVEDRAVVRLLYERRHVEQSVQQGAIDTWFDRQSAGLTPEQRVDLKRKYSAPNRLHGVESRLREIAWDVALHFRQEWKGTGYKAQLVAPSKRAAVLLRDFIAEAGAALPPEERTTCEVVISLTDEREGLEPGQEARDDETVEGFTRQMLTKYGSEERYNESIIGAFDSPEGPDLIICVDKLLTGFDAPRNTVLYLARPLRSHTLLQAIARVNRLHEGKEFGYILDYVGVLEDLDQALTEYGSLEGFDLDDVEEAFHNVADEVARLPDRYARLLDLFREVANPNDGEAHERALANPEVRTEFRGRFAAFAKTLRIALATETFYAETPVATIERYKADLARFARLRKAVEIRYGDAVDMAKIEPAIAKLLDTYVASEPVEVLTAEPIDIMNAEAMEETLDTLKTDAARADAIAAATERTIAERMDEDPIRFRRFSEMVQETIRAFQEHRLSEMEYLREMRQRQAQVVDSIRGRLTLEGRERAGAYGRTIESRWERIRGASAGPDTLAELALKIDEAITRRASVVDWRNRSDATNGIRSDVDELFYEYSGDGRLVRDWSAFDEIAAELLRIAWSRLP